MVTKRGKSMKKAVLLITVTLVLLSAQLFALNETVLVVFPDGGAEYGKLKGWADDVLTLESNGKTSLIPIGNIAILYFIDSGKVSTSGQMIDPNVYVYQGNRYTIGSKNGETALYGPDWTQITDAELVADFKKMDLLADALLREDKIAQLEGYIEDIKRTIVVSEIQKISANIRDFAAGVAVNSVIAALNTGLAL